MTERQEFIEKQIKETGCSKATAKYRWSKVRQGKDFIIQNRKDYTKEHFDKIGFTVKVDANSQYGYSVYQNGRLRPIQVMKTGNYKRTDSKYHLQTWFYEDGKQKNIALATVIMVCIIGKDVPNGFCVDHIDNDAFNNDLDNLQILSIGENVKKDHKGHNQFKY